MDSVVLFRDPFPILNGNFLNQGPDRNTRVIVFATDLALAPGETSSAVVVNLVDSSNKSFDVTAEDVRARDPRPERAENVDRAAGMVAAEEAFGAFSK